MSPDSRKAGVILRTVPVADGEKIKRRFKEVTFIIPVHPFYKSPEFAKILVGYFGREFAAAMAKRMVATKQAVARKKPTPPKRKAKWKGLGTQATSRIRFQDTGRSNSSRLVLRGVATVLRGASTGSQI